MEEKSEAEKIKLALEILYGSQLDEVMQRLKGTNLTLANYKLFAEEVEKFLNTLDRYELKRHEEFLDMKKEIDQFRIPLTRQDVLGVFTPTFEMQDRLVALYIAAVNDSTRWKIVGRNAMERYFSTLAAKYEQIDWSPAEKEELKRDLVRQIDLITQIARAKGVDIDMKETLLKLEDQKEQVEIKAEIHQTELEVGFEASKEFEMLSFIRRYYEKNGNWPNTTELYAFVGGITYERMTAIKNLVKQGKVLKTHEGRTIRYVINVEQTLREKAIKTAPKSEKTRDFQESDETEGVPDGTSSK